jgi:glycosyltransferase involved in cell wall biosynthesis
MTTKPALSIVIPALNEAPNLDLLRDSLLEALEPLGKTFEIIFVDDGSTDESFDRISDYVREDSRIRGLRMRRHVGKANTLAAGFSVARADIILTMDADNQDDPCEIPRFLEKLEEGYDLVNGWKQSRQDPWVRVMTSLLFNRVVRWISGIPLHDINCGFKVMRAGVAHSLKLYGDWHRFIPVIVAEEGYRVGEIEVVHHPRRKGRSRYGIERYYHGLVDCLSLLSLVRFSERPAHLFAGTGAFLGSGGIISLLAGIPLYLNGRYPIKGTACLLFGILFILLGLQLILTGLLAEIYVARNPPDRAHQAIAERVGFTED